MKRRTFLAAIAALPIVGRSGVGDEKARPWRIDVVGADEPGKRIVVAGTIHGPDGKTPAANVKMFVYHTDAEGWYTRPPVNSPRRSRLHGTLWTDERGRYEFATVEPGHYADLASPPSKHIHVHLEPPGLPDHWVDSFKFAGDPRLSPEEVKSGASLGAYSPILTFTKDGKGRLEARRDFRIDPELARRNRLGEDWSRE